MENLMEIEKRVDRYLETLMKGVEGSAECKLEHKIDPNNIKDMKFLQGKYESIARVYLEHNNLNLAVICLLIGNNMLAKAKRASNNTSRN